jgi:hypothetical protein
MTSAVPRDLIAKIERHFSMLNAGFADYGGLTFWKKSREKGNLPRALVYWGPLPVASEPPFRELLEPYDIAVSAVRNPAKSGWRTATVGDEMGY